MFTTTDLPRNFFPERAGSWHASLERSIGGAGIGSAFTLYNPLAALESTRQLVVITGIYYLCRDESVTWSLQRSSDVADLDGLTNVLAASNTCPCNFSAPLDAMTVLAQGDSVGYVPALDGAFFRASSDTDSDKNLLAELEYPLVLPAGFAVVLTVPASSGARTDTVNWRWFRA